MLVADVLDDTPEAQSFRLRVRRRWGEFSRRLGSWLAVLLGHATLLVDRAFLLIAARVAEVADDARAW